MTDSMGTYSEVWPFKVLQHDGQSLPIEDNSDVKENKNVLDKTFKSFPVI